MRRALAWLGYVVCWSGALIVLGWLALVVYGAGLIHHWW